jgi:DNA replication protein DnaC
MINKKKLYKDIEELTIELKLPAIKNKFEEDAKDACINDISYEEFLYKLLEKEYVLRSESSKQNRIRIARFPYKKYIEDLVIEDLPADAKKKLKMLSSLEFINTGQNVILAGNPGTGKTHMAVGLGIKACLAGYKVLFITVSALITQLKESRSQKVLRAFENKFDKYDLIIADELGYISYDKEGSELLFSHLSLRAGRKSTIVTTNLSFERWNEIFKDPIMTAAMIDRLTHKAYIVNMNGNSYRLKETKEWLEKQH